MLQVQDVIHSAAATVKANGIEIVYDTFGDPSAPPLLLIMGLGGQMIAWDEQFCAQLASKGYYVIRFDNRDVGLSTRFDHARVPNIVIMLLLRKLRIKVKAPYTLHDMAADSVGLLDALAIESAHIVGISMGGMIAQMIAIHHPQRARTLTSMLSTTGHPSLPAATREALAHIRQRPPDDLEAYVASILDTLHVLNGPLIPLNEERIRSAAAASFKRGFYPPGTTRQFAAIIASGSRRQALLSLDTPTLVIHGDSDPLVRLAGGIDTANSIPGAQSLIIEGMGHNLPPVKWPQIIDAIAAHAR